MRYLLWGTVPVLIFTGIAMGCLSEGTTTEPGLCRTARDCPSVSQICEPKEGFWPCSAESGADECTTDADCQTGICEPHWPWCDQARRVCRKGCEDVECGPVKDCASDGHCRAQPCTSKEDCGPNRSCDPQGACQLRACSKDSDCDGVCVNELCSEATGTCTNQE